MCYDNDFSDYTNGLSPNVSQLENLGNLGVLGNETEPLLNTALNYINTNGRTSQRIPNIVFNHFEDCKSMRLFGDEMYLD